MTGDIASTAELTVHEQGDGGVRFASGRPFGQNAASCSAVSAPAREDDGVSRREPPTQSRVWPGVEELAEVAE
jgi:hypothetical protein